MAWHHKGSQAVAVVVAQRVGQHMGQEVSLDLSGWVGTLDFPPDDAAAIADLLAAAEFLGVGRSTSAGLGRFRLHWRP